MSKAKIYISSIILFTLFVWIFGGDTSFAQMAGTAYKIQSDSINFGGGYSSSTTYRSESTFGEIATGSSSSATYGLQAGYQQMQEVYVAIVPPVSDVMMSPDIGGITGGTSNGSASVTVITDSMSGYTLTMVASTSPFLRSGSETIANYTSAILAVPDFTFALDSQSDSEFGFTPEGTDIASKYKDDGVSTCSTGSTDTADACWWAIKTGRNETVASRTSSNHPAGTATTLKFRTMVGTSRIQPEGTYVGTTTLTAVAN